MSISRESGFTLMEVLIAVTIIGISASLAIPTFQKTRQTAYWRSAQDILQTVYTGEQVRQARNGSYLDVSPGSGNWGEIFMDDPNAVAVPLPAQFSVVTANAGANFTARAFRGTTTGPCMCMTDGGGRVVQFAGCGCAGGDWTRP